MRFDRFRGVHTPGNYTVNELGQPIGLAIPSWRPPPPPSRSTLQGDYCRLEPLDPDRHAGDLHAAHALDTTGSGWTYLPYGPFESGSAYRRWVGEMSCSTDPFLYAIIERKEERAS